MLKNKTSSSKTNTQKMNKISEINYILMYEVEIT